MTIRALALLFLILLLPAGARADRVALADAFAQAGIEASPAHTNAALLDEIIDRVADMYVEPRQPQALSAAAAQAVRALPKPATPEAAFRAAAEALTKELDPYTAYLPPTEMDDMMATTSGEFGGIGVEITLKDEKPVVVAPIDDTPAARAGLTAGDVITHVDGQPVAGLPLGEVVSRIRGRIGTTVRLTLDRAKAISQTITIRRDIIRIMAVKGRLEGGDVAYLRISQFAGGVAATLRDTLSDLDGKAGGKLKGIVLDLRSNPGGLLDQAIAVSDLFLGEVPIVAIQGRRAGDRRVYNGRTGEMLDRTPMVILIDGGSASASEIVAGALHDNRRAVLVGQKSFGKGSVQTVMNLSKGGLRVTTARYLRPNTQPVDKVGIQPDVAVEPVENADPQLDRALKMVKER